MEEINSLFDIAELIARDMGGHLDENERMFLQKWLDRSDENKEVYNKILNNKNLADRNLICERINTIQAWDKVAESLEIKSKTKRVIWMQVLKYAAVIVFPVLLILSGYWMFHHRPEEIISPVAQIQAGSSNAVLVLDDGKSIELSNDSVKSLVEKDGTIIKNSNSELSYANSNLPNSSGNLRNTLIVPRGGEYTLSLSDGSKLIVNSMSKLIFPVKFTGNKREITLVEGEAYFEVVKDKSRPFIVSVKGAKVEVLGTSFDIKAYPDDNCSYTTLVEGKVKHSLCNKPSVVNFLAPDQQAVFNMASSEVAIHKVDAKQLVQWTVGTYSFTNQTLEEIMKTLSRWYDFDYSFEDESLKTVRFEGGLNKYERIEPILDIISKTGKVQVKVKGKEIIFSKV